MPHHVYTTRGVVLALKPTREADAVALVLTRDLGLVTASARGLRKRGSKLSGSLLELSSVKVSLVRGKSAWRVTTVSLIRNTASELRGKRAYLSALARTAALLRRLVRGEEKNADLYDAFEKRIELLFTDIDIEEWEVKTVAEMLYALGYLREEDLNLEKKQLIKAINDGLKESGLA